MPDPSDPTLSISEDHPEATENHQPHDRFFKCLLEEMSVARDLLQRYLPREVLGLIDLSYLEQVPSEGFLQQKIVPDIVLLSQATQSRRCVMNME